MLPAMRPAVVRSVLLATWLVSGAAAPAFAVAGATCGPWPGEPDPLPTVASTDSFERRWAELRAAELYARAEAWKVRSASIAAALGSHAACLLGREDTRERVLVRIHRPQVGYAGTDAAPAIELDARLAIARPKPKTAATRPKVLAKPEPSPPAPEARVARHTPPVRPAPVPALPDAGSALAEAEAAYRAARFEDALAAADRATATLAQAPDAAPVREQRVRAGVLGGTSALALGREAEAREHFAAALRAQPDLTLDPAVHSPKILQVFRAVAEEGAR